MRVQWIISGLFVLAFLAAVQLPAQQEPWQMLFNGKDLQGWQKLNGDAEYRVEDGAIIGVSRTNTPNTFLATGRNFADFILELEVMIDPLLNSGIQIRSNSLPSYQNGRVHGYQVEIDPSMRAFSGGIYDEARRGWLYPLSLNPMGQSAFRNGEWNKYHIEAIGNEIRVWVNGVNTANIVDDVTAEGFIALQVHSIKNIEMEGRVIKWRNIRILTQGLEQARWPMHPGVPEENFVANTLSAYELRKGFRLLWDGKTKNGWHSAKGGSFPQNGWRIEDGILKTIESGGGESVGGGDIVTEEQFTNFELKVDFLITKGANSGIKYFVDPELNQGQGSAIGLEFQILDDTGHPDAQQGIAGNRTLASLYDLIPASNLSDPSRTKDFRGVGQWNQARIVVQGNHVEHWLNGFKMVEFDRRTPMFRSLVAYSKYKVWPGFGEWTKGHILLQEHGNEVWFRSIKVREF